MLKTLLKILTRKKPQDTPRETPQCTSIVFYVDKDEARIKLLTNTTHPPEQTVAEVSYLITAIENGAALAKIYETLIETGKTNEELVPFVTAVLYQTAEALSQPLISAFQVLSEGGDPSED